jgi:tetratricopeptide (TPR) repeat protein
LGALLDQPTSALPGPGELMLPGAVDPSTNTQTYFVASELFGVKQFNLGSTSDQFLLGNSSNLQQRIYLNQLQLDPREMEQMRQELLNMSPTFTPPGANNNLINNQPTNAATGNGSMSANSSVGTGQLPGTPLTGTVGQTQQLTPTNLSAQQGTLAYHLSPQAAQQSSIYGKMQQELEAFYNSKDKYEADKAAALIHNMQAPKPTPAAQQPGVLPKPPQGTQAVLPRMPSKPAPVMVGSLAQGVSVKGLHDVLQRAEEFMKAGKFSTAIDAYEAAGQIAQGQPVISLVWIGLANADLGAGYYLRAASQLQQAFAKDPALLMAKYDLHTFIGDDRLEAIIKDLKASAAKDPTNPSPIFLLAYISYNTNNERAAAAYLVLADQRAGGKDPIYKLIRDHWTLPEEAPATQPTK